MLTVSNNVPSDRAILFGINKFYLFFMLIPAACMLRPQFDEKWLVGRLTLLFLPLLLLGLAQYAYNDPLMPLVSEDGSYYKILTPDFYGQNRALSLFRSGMDFGQGTSFFLSLLIARGVVANRRQLCWLVPLAVLTAAANYVTFRRGAYLEFGAAAVAALAIAKRWRFCRWLPWVFLLCGLLLVSGGTLAGTASSRNVLSSESLAERHEAWRGYLDRWLFNGTPGTILFGTGLCQSGEDDPDAVLIDNEFVGVGGQIGLVGLAIWAWVMMALWRDLLVTAQTTGSLLATAGAAVLSAWMMHGLTELNFAYYPIYVFLCWWTRRTPPPRAEVAPLMPRYQRLQVVFRGSPACD